MQEGYVYLMVGFSGDSEKYKIGITIKDPEKRLKQLQTGSSDKIDLLRKYKSPFYKKIEKFLHRKYMPYKCEGGSEWFDLPDEEALNFILECEKTEQMFKSLVDNPFLN
jgi:hypothetical protein